jgi:hypothetical protein
MKNNNEGATTIVVVALLLAGAGYWFYSKNKGKIDTASKWWSIF